MVAADTLHGVRRAHGAGAGTVHVLRGAGDPADDMTDPLHLTHTDGVTVSVSALEEILGVSRPTIGRFVARGMPKAARGKYDLIATVRWVLEQQGGEREPEVADQRLELLKEQTQTAQLKNAILRGELVRREDLHDIVLELGGMITEVLDIVPTWTDSAEIRGELRARASDHRRHVERRLRDLSRTRSSGGADSESAGADGGAVGGPESGAPRGH